MQFSMQMNWGTTAVTARIFFLSYYVVTETKTGESMVFIQQKKRKIFFILSAFSVSVVIQIQIWYYLN